MTATTGTIHVARYQSRLRMKASPSADSSETTPQVTKGQQQAASKPRYQNWRRKRAKSRIACVASGNFTLNLVKAFQRRTRQPSGRARTVQSTAWASQSQSPWNPIPVVFRQASRILFLLQQSQSSPFPSICQTDFAWEMANLEVVFDAEQEWLHYSFLQLSSGITEIVALDPRCSPVHQALWEMSHVSWKTVSDRGVVGPIRVGGRAAGDPPELSVIPHNRPLPAALLAAYNQGGRDLTIAPGTYILPATRRNSIELTGWSNAAIHAKGVTIIFADADHRPRVAQPLHATSSSREPPCSLPASRSRRGGSRRSARTPRASTATGRSMPDTRRNRPAQEYF